MRLISIKTTTTTLQNNKKMSNHSLTSLVIVLVVVWILNLSTLNVTNASSSFVTKINHGFERLVVSIHDSLALPPTSSSSVSSSSSSFGGIGIGSSSNFQHKGATHQCQAVLEQLKELITKTSEFLFKATNGESYFRQVSILLPGNWATSNCTRESQEVVSTAIYQTINSADIIITPDHPVYIDRPWTLQYGPCGAPGKHVSIPLSFLSNGNDLKARLIVREWLKLRYGVFDENGFSHDEKYPAEFIGESTSLLSSSIGGQQQHQQQQQQINGKLVQTTCHLNRSCGDEPCVQTMVVPSSKNLQEASLTLPKPLSSMMSLPLDPHGNELCNEKTHLRTTPTKHNFLCDGRSIWEVMRDHGDFKNILTDKNLISNETPTSSSSNPSLNNNNLSLPPSPIFSFVVSKSHRMVFLLDRGKGMNQNNRWINLRRSLFRMFHYVPSGVELGVISYTNSSTLSLPLTIAGTHNRDQLHGRIPLRPLSKELSESCVSCAIRAAVKLIKSSNENIGPTTLVLVNGSPSKLMSKDWDKMNKLIESIPLRLVVITYTNESIELIQLARFGTFFKIPSSPQANTNLEQNEFLNNIFLKIINENIATPLNKIYESNHWPDSEWTARGQFTMEDSLGRSTWVTVTTEELGDVDGLQLVSPSAKEFELPVHAEGLLFLKIPGVSEAGIWTYIIKFYQNPSPRPISVDVITESRKPEAILVKLWNLVLKPTTKDSTEVVILYAQVLQGELPVLNSNVTVTINIPGQSLHHHGPNTVSVRLLDTGSGDADITWGDGIYSGYFTQLGANPGFFSLTAHIDDNGGQAVVPVHTNITRGMLGLPICCGSSVPHIATIPTGSFVRKVAGPSFYISQGIPFGDDPFPPGRVTDLRVERMVDSASEVKLSWTAPGGDYDKGKAARYEIRCYTSRSALTNDNFGTQGILVHNSLTPEPEEFGIRQSCTVGVPWSNEIFYYGIVSIDNGLNHGKVSNLVSVLIKEAPTSTHKIIDAWEDDALVSNLTSTRSLLNNHYNNKYEQNVFQVGATWFRGLSELELYIIIGGASAFLLLVSTLILILVCIKKQNKNKHNENGPPAYHNIYVGVGKTSSSSSTTTTTSNNIIHQHHNNKDGLNCCWENDSNGTEIQNIPKMNDLKSTYMINSDSTTASSYIPASALCGPPSGGSLSIYRDLYNTTINNTQDSSSVDSKPSDREEEDGGGSGSGGGSNETVHVTDPISFYTSPILLSSSTNHHLNLSRNFDNNLINNNNNQVHNNIINNSRRNIDNYSHNNHNTHSPSDDDDGGFKSSSSQQHQRISLSTPNGGGGGCGGGDDSFNKILSIPCGVGNNSNSEYDSPSMMNGSTYGGSIMSIPSHKKRTRHISFV